MTPRCSSKPRNVFRPRFFRLVAGARVPYIKIMRFLLLILLLFPISPADAQTRVVPEQRQQVLWSFAPVVEEVTPSVVNIYTRRRVQRRPMSLFDDPFFRRFFGDIPMEPSGRQPVQQSLGSGVIVESSGLIITNHHVVEGSEDITVVLSDRREFPATLLHADARTDLAVLQLQAGGRRFPALRFGDAEALAVGDLVLAIGNPFGVGQTVTSGIISGLARTTVGITDFRFFIQTDAAINPGNSGGPLVTLDGRMIGINTAIFSRDGGSNGIGFAIPVSMVQSVLLAAQAGGAAQRPWLGAATQTVTFELAQSLGLEKPDGVIVTSVQADSPAAKAGLRDGDILLTLDGKALQDAEGLRFRLATLPPTARIAVDVYRDGRRLTLPLALVPPPDVPARNATVLQGEHPLQGATVININPAVIEETNIPPESRGVMISEVSPRSLARRFGLQREDIIVSVNGVDVANVAALLPVLQQPSPRWALQVQRGEQRLQLVIGG